MPSWHMRVAGRGVKRLLVCSTCSPRAACECGIALAVCKEKERGQWVSWRGGASNSCSAAGRQKPSLARSSTESSSVANAHVLKTVSATAARTRERVESLQGARLQPGSSGSLRCGSCTCSSGDAVLLSHVFNVVSLVLARCSVERWMRQLKRRFAGVGRLLEDDLQRPAVA